VAGPKDLHCANWAFISKKADRKHIININSHAFETNSVQNELIEGMDYLINQTSALSATIARETVMTYLDHVTVDDLTSHRQLLLLGVVRLYDRRQYAVSKRTRSLKHT